jgi:hypothetical protein
MQDRTRKPWARSRAVYQVNNVCYGSLTDLVFSGEPRLVVGVNQNIQIGPGASPKAVAISSANSLPKASLMALISSKSLGPPASRSGSS